MQFDPHREPVTPRDAASVILLRDREGQAEVFLLRRHKKASFMARSFVFPGGARDPGEDLTVTAARELFEEAGVLLADVDARHLTPWRAAVAQGEALSELLGKVGASLDLDGLVFLAHWITPSAEKKRFSARFFAAELPPGQTPSFDNVETVDELWVTPAEALERVGELRLPPPQIRILADIAQAAREGTAAVLHQARQRADQVRGIMPRFAVVEGAPNGFALLLPWDPEYDSLGQGLGEAMPVDHPLAGGPSRFVIDDDGWRLISP